jgi:hypothetical protein
VEEDPSSEASQKKPSLIYILSDPTTKSLILTNLLVIVIAVIQDWELSTILWVYWSQSIIIGFFNFLRLLLLKDFYYKGKGNWPFLKSIFKYYMAVFFAFHYGLFHLAYAIFIGSDFSNDLTWSVLQAIILGSSVFFINHFFSFLKNLEHDEIVRKNIDDVFSSPYIRIIPMHIIILVGANLGGFAIISFLLLKTAADTYSHAVKHGFITPWFRQPT